MVDAGHGKADHHEAVHGKADHHEAGHGKADHHGAGHGKAEHGFIMLNLLLMYNCIWLSEYFCILRATSCKL